MILTDPFRTQTFYVELGDVFKGPVLKVMGLVYEREVKTVHQANDKGNTQINQLRGKYMPATLTIHKAITEDKSLWDWRQQVLDVEDIRKVRLNGFITAFGLTNGVEPLKWKIINAWPSRIKGPMLNIEAEAAFEEIELCYQELAQVEGLK